MRFQQGSVLETLRRVPVFLDANAAILGSISQSGVRQDLERVTSEFAEHAVVQSASTSSSRGETARQKVLRARLRENHMKPIAAIARAKLRTVPEFKEMRMPHFRINVERLTAQANAMAENAGKYAEVFVASGLSPDFANALRAAAAEVQQSIDARGLQRVRCVGATEGLKQVERQARALLKVMDSLVLPALGINDRLVAEWRSIRNIAAKPVMPADGSGSAASSPPAATPPGGGRTAKAPPKEVTPAAA